jgi:hypothetical protein
MTALVYGRSLGYGFARTEEQKLADAVGRVDLAGIWNGLFLDLSRVAEGLSGLWRPTVNLAYLIAGWIGGGEAWAFRLVSLVCLAVLVWAARRPLGKGKGRGLVLALIIFHPMTSAAVLDVSALPSLLCAMCGVLALTHRGRTSFFWAIAALGAHEVGFALPFIAMAIPRDPQGKRRGPDRWMIPMGGVIVGIATALSLRSLGVIGPDAVGIPTIAGGAGAASHVWFYMGRLLLPLVPVFSRTAPIFESPWPAMAWVLLLGVLWLVIVSKRPREKPFGPGFAAGFCCIVLALLGSGGLVSEVVGYGEDRLILPIVGLAWILASRPTSRVAGWALLTAFVPLTLLRVAVWADPANLWAESHRARPSDILVSLEYGQRLIGVDSARAVGLLEQVTASDPGPGPAFKAHVGLVQAWFELDQEERALPHLARIADPNVREHSWLLVRRCILETRFGVDEAEYQEGSVLSPLARVCGEAAERYPRHARLANAAGVQAAIRGDTERAQGLLQRAVELAPHSAEYRRGFTRIPMHVMGWREDEPLSPDPAAAP